VFRLQVLCAAVRGRDGRDVLLLWYSRGKGGVGAGPVGGESWRSRGFGVAGVLRAISELRWLFVAGVNWKQTELRKLHVG
jgi:hypothetical protein